MKVFFAASTGGIGERKRHYQAITNILASNDQTILPSWIIEALSSRLPKGISSEEVLRKQVQLVQACDIVVAEVSAPSFGVGYILGQALVERKHILCLYPAEADIDQLSDFIKGSTSSLITLKLYTENDIEKIIRHYLETVRVDQLQKFNFLVSPEIAEYIELGARKAGKSKSEFLRDKITRNLMR